MTHTKLLPCAIALLLTASACKKDSKTPVTESTTPDTVVIEPKNPDTAPQTRIDRFSPQAAHLMIRTATNGLPANNAPVNFDQAPFITLGKTPDGKMAQYYNFDVQSTAPASIYVLYRDGEASPVSGQINIVNVKPGDAGYNDFWRVVKVTVPKNYVANTLTSYSAIEKGAFTLETTSKIVNCPVVPHGSTAGKRFTNESTALVKGWYKDSVVFYFNFSEKALSGSTVPVVPIYVTFNTNGNDASGFVVEAGTSQTHNVIGAVPGDSFYSPLWSINVYDNTAFANVLNIQALNSVTILATNVTNVNCPVVAIN